MTEAWPTGTTGRATARKSPSPNPQKRARPGVVEGCEGASTTRNYKLELEALAAAPRTFTRLRGPTGPLGGTQTGRSEVGAPGCDRTGNPSPPTAWAVQVEFIVTTNLGVFLDEFFCNKLKLKKLQQNMCCSSY